MLRTMLVATLLLSLSALAEDELCKHVEDMAIEVMENRQSQVRIADMLDVADKMGKEYAPLGELVREMIFDAYERPRVIDPKERKLAVLDFQNDAYRKCIKETMD